MRGEELYKHKQAVCKCDCKHNATIDLFYKIKLSRNETYLDIEDKSKSFLRQLAAYIHSIFRFSSTSGLTVRKTDGSTVTIPLLSVASSSGDTRAFANHTILVSNNSNDRFLTFDDFNISHITATRVSGYPQLSYSIFADRYEGIIQDAWLYTGSDTYIYAVGLKVVNNLWAGVSIGELLIAKDVFYPPLQLLSNSRIDVSYKIVISL